MSKTTKSITTEDLRKIKGLESFDIEQDREYIRLTCIVSGKEYKSTYTPSLYGAIFEIIALVNSDIKLMQECVKG